MSKKYVFSFLVMFGAFAYLTIPGCGNKSNNNPNGGTAIVPPNGAPCLPGQNCSIPGPGGIPLLSGPSFSSLDSRGSSILLSFAAQQVVAGQPYSGPVTVSGTINLAPGSCFYLPPGSYPIQGQGIWVSNYGGALGGVEATLQMNNGTVQIYAATVRFGQDPLNPQGSPTGYYMHGQVYVSACNITFTAL